MSDFFKQLLNQLNIIWGRLNLTQKVIIVSTAVITIIGMTVIIAWSSLSPREDGYATLFVNLEAEDAAQVTEALKEMGISYKLENGGRTLTVPKKELYEVRMEMARNGLPKNGGQAPPNEDGRAANRPHRPPAPGGRTRPGGGGFLARGPLPARPDLM